jgi:hypothetical protein
MDNQIEEQVKKTFLSNKVVESGIYRLLAISLAGVVVKYQIEKQLPSLHWKPEIKFVHYQNAANSFLSIK